MTLHTELKVTEVDYYKSNYGETMSRQSKSQQLLEIASRSMENGDRSVAKGMVVLAMKQEDAIDALDRLLPGIHEPEEFEDFEVEEDTLSESQVAKIVALARELGDLKKTKIVNQILSKVEHIEARKRRARKT